MIIVISMFSPVYNVNDKENYLYELRKIVKKRDLILIATVPVFLYNDNIRLYFDVVLLVRGLAFEDGLRSYDGLMEVRKCHAVGYFNAESAGMGLYGVRRSRYGLQIENVEIPPDSSEVDGCHVQDMF